MISLKDVTILTGIVDEERISTEKSELFCYSRDLGNSIPDELLKAYGMLGPDVVILPENTEEISAILSYAYENDIPVTTRGGGSWALGGALPMDGGIVIDMGKLNEIKTVNKGDGYVTVGAGLTWKRLMDNLVSHGLMVGAHPSSSVSATIGGFLATGGGAGTGVPQYGTVGDQVLSLTVVRADGNVIRTDPWSSWLFVGSEGTLGIITEATLKVFTLQKLQHYLFYFDSIESGTDVLQKLSEIRPYQLSFLDRGFLYLLNQAGEHCLVKELAVAVSISGSPEELKLKSEKIEKICAAGQQQPDYVARDEYENRFRIGLVFKCLGPSLFVQEIRVPLRFIGKVVKDISTLLKGYTWGIESLGSDTGSIVLSVMILGDEREEIEYLRTFSLSANFGALAAKYCGTVYGIGLHNAVAMRGIHHEGLDRMREMRLTLDKRNILNSGKTTYPRIPVLFVAMFMFMMKTVPFLVRFMLDTMKYVPIGLLRFGLSIVGGKIK
ncbi:MAG: FAD-binding oxidoreductase [Candidatus Cloacimonadota bacterium]|nr:MAG: FAD-binding oxidoreductase [Candidatus Cloacimonadota bacterium]